jgi:hypothetical protein
LFVRAAARQRPAMQWVADVIPSQSESLPHVTSHEDVPTGHEGPGAAPRHLARREVPTHLAASLQAKEHTPQMHE